MLLRFYIDQKRTQLNITDIVHNSIQILTFANDIGLLVFVCLNVRLQVDM